MQTFKIQTIHEKIKNDSASLRIKYIVDFFQFSNQFSFWNMTLNLRKIINQVVL